MPKPIHLIVACTANRVIGRNGRLPFNIPEDRAWFHARTAGQTVVLGGISFATWSKVLADDRQPVVVSHDKSLASDRVKVASSITEALAIAERLSGEILICGGQRIYEETLPLANRIYLTLVHAEMPGDRWFPEWRHLDWRETWHREGANVDFRYTFSILDRRVEAGP